MATTTRYYGTTMYGNGTARYQLIMDVTVSGTRSGTVTVYLYAMADVSGGYNFSYGNSLSVTVAGSTIYSSSNVGTVQCQTTGTLTQLWSGSWSVSSSATETAFSASFSQTQDTRYSGTVSGTMTFGASAPSGYLDSVSNTKITGWCALSGSDVRYSVSANIFTSSGTLLKQIPGTADIYRADLKSAGMGMDIMDMKFIMTLPLNLGLETMQYRCMQFIIQELPLSN